MEAVNSEEGKKIQVLKKISFLDAFSENELQFLLSIAKWIKTGQGDSIFKERTEGTSFYIILKGSVSVHKVIGSGSIKKRLCVIEAGECFGEMSLILRSPRSADIIAAEETYLLKVDAETLDKEEETPLHKSVQYKIYKKFSEILAKRLLEADNVLMQFI